MQHYVLVFVLSGWRSQGRSVNNDDSKICSVNLLTIEMLSVNGRRSQQYISVNLMMIGKKNLSKN